MLVLSRRKDDAIVIGDGITIRVLSIHSGTVILGVTAPKDVPVNRGEVHERIEANRRSQEIEVEARAVEEARREPLNLKQERRDGD